MNQTFHNYSKNKNAIKYGIKICRNVFEYKKNDGKSSIDWMKRRKETQIKKNKRKENLQLNDFLRQKRLKSHHKLTH